MSMDWPVRRLPPLALLLWSSIAFGDQVMRDNQSGADAVTGLPRYGIYDLTSLSVCTTPIGQAPLMATCSINDNEDVFVTNSSTGTSAAAGWLLGSGAFAVPPYLAGTLFGTNFVPPNARVPAWVPGNGAIVYAGTGEFIVDITRPSGSGATPGWAIETPGAPDIEAPRLSGDWAGNVYVPGLGGSGVVCVEADNTGKLIATAGPCASGTGTVTSVTGTSGRIVATPSSPNPVVDLATFSTASMCAWANVVTDAWGRTTCTANAAPQPAGSYITALTHDVVAAGPGSAAAEVVGVTDGTSVDHPVAASAWTNGQALALDGSGDIHTSAFQAPLTACTDYVSIACQTTGTDIANTNAQVHVDAVHESGGARRPVGSVGAPGEALVWDGSFVAGYLPLGDLGNDYTAPTVLAIEETSTPARLAIGGIPALAVLSRSGTTVVGDANFTSDPSTHTVTVHSLNASNINLAFTGSTLAGFDPSGNLTTIITGSGLAFNPGTETLSAVQPAGTHEVSYYVNTGFLAIATGEYLITNVSTNGGGAAVIEYPIQYGSGETAPSNLSISINMIAGNWVNSGGTCAMGAIGTLNGSATSASTLFTAPGKGTSVVGGLTIANVSTMGVTFFAAHCTSPASYQMTITLRVF